MDPFFLPLPRCVILLPQAPPGLEQSIEEGVNVTGDFCSLDGSGKRVKDRTLGEMEQVGLERGMCVCVWVRQSVLAAGFLGWRTKKLVRCGKRQWRMA